MTELLRRGKRIEQSRRAQFRLATGTDQLQQLHGEFDFADAAGAKLQVLLAFAPLDFGIDARLQLAQAFDGSEVEVFAIHEGTQAGDQFGTGDTIAGTVGRCGYELHPSEADPDTFSQVVRTQGYNITMRINGRQELQRLPPADQAALVPLMLYCDTAKVFENFGRDPPELGFGGQEGAQPPKTINFGPQGNRSCGG